MQLNPFLRRGPGSPGHPWLVVEALGGTTWLPRQGRKGSLAVPGRTWPAALGSASASGASAVQELYRSYALGAAGRALAAERAEAGTVPAIYWSDALAHARQRFRIELCRWQRPGASPWGSAMGTQSTAR